MKTLLLLVCLAATAAAGRAIDESEQASACEEGSRP